MQKYIPKVYEHFNSLYINIDLFFVFWFQNLYVPTLNFQLVLRILDLFLIYGDEILFQVGLTIIKIQEENLLTYPINEIFKVLKRLPNKYDEEIFLEILEGMNIHEQYNNKIVNNMIEEQKQLLMEYS